MTFIINNKRSQVSQTKHTSKYQQKLNTSFLDRYHQSSSKSVSIIFTTYICRFHFLEIDYCCYFFVSKEWIIYYDLLILPTFEYMDYEGLKRILKEIKKTASKLHTIGPCITGSDLKGHSVEYTCKVAIIRERGILRTKL